MPMLMNQCTKEIVNGAELLKELCEKLDLLADGGKKTMEIEYRGDVITLTVMQKGWDDRAKKDTGKWE